MDLETNHLSYPQKIFLYGPPGSGKTVTGRRLAQALGCSFTDLDESIEKGRGMTVAEIFAGEGEGAFRLCERQALESALQAGPTKSVVALGGGALLDPQNRAMVEAAGPVVCLAAGFSALLSRVAEAAGQRPLLGSSQALQERLSSLLERRSRHYASFPLQVDTTNLTPERAAHEAQICLGWFHVEGQPGYDVIVRPTALAEAGMALAETGLSGPVALVSDAHVAPVYSARVTGALLKSGYQVAQITLPPGESGKTAATLEMLWQGFVEAGLERGSLVAALGGGVVGDLAGFAAATFLRGVPWAVLPTTLLAMCDSAIGGKTGADLPQGKNLIGAFHSPRLVLSDPETLATLPPAEIRSGLAEVVKAGLIGDPVLFSLCEKGLETVQSHWSEIVSRAAAVKIQVIQADPYEKGLRAVLNLGHTVGHAIEWASGYRLKHGEAVAIGMVVEAHLGEKIGVAEAGLAERVAAVLRLFGLPVGIPAGMPVEEILSGMKVDKKRRQGKVHFALPVKVGEARHGIVIEEENIWSLLNPTLKTA